MKRIITTAVLILIIGTASFAGKAVAKGKTHSALGDYRIEKAENPVTIDGMEYKAFRVTYENSPMDVKVIVMKDKKARKFVVVSDKLSIQYSRNEYFFGVERIDKALSDKGLKTTDENLNRAEYFHQKVLGPGLLLDRKSVQTVAAFFPFLLTPEATMLAVN